MRRGRTRSLRVLYKNQRAEEVLKSDLGLLPSVICFRAETYINSPRLSAPSCPIKPNMRLYCHVVIGLAKRHKTYKNAIFLPSFKYSILTRHTTTAAFFDCSLSRIRSTHVGSYALDKSYPAELQSELIERCFQNIRSGMNVLLTGKWYRWIVFWMAGHLTLTTAAAVPSRQQ